MTYRQPQALTITLRLPATWQGVGRIQRAIRDAEALLNRHGVTPEQFQKLINCWTDKLGFVRYSQLEREIMDGDSASPQRAFPEIGVETFEIITAALLLSLGPLMQRAEGQAEAKQELTLWAYTFALNLYAARSVVAGRNVREAQRKRASFGRLNWKDADAALSDLRGKIPARNLASAIAARTGISAKQVRKHYGLGRSSGK